MCEKRHIRNIGALTPEENEKLRGMEACVVGCGGLGGYITEMLARLGIGSIRVADGELFDETNLNRQILCTPGNIGMSKAEAAGERIHLIDQDIEVHTFRGYFDEKNGHEIIGGADIVFDALDSEGSRKDLEKKCEQENIPLVHGAVEGWSGQVCVVFPGDRTLDRLLASETGHEEETVSSLSFGPALVAALQVAEGLKVLLGRENTLRGRLLGIDLITQEYEVMEI